MNKAIVVNGNKISVITLAMASLILSAAARADNFMGTSQDTPTTALAGVTSGSALQQNNDANTQIYSASGAAIYLINNDDIVGAPTATNTTASFSTSTTTLNSVTNNIGTDSSVTTNNNIGNSASTNTILGTTNINTTGSANTSIGNTTGTVAMLGSTVGVGTNSASVVNVGSTTGNSTLNFNNNRLQNVGNAVAGTDAVNLNQLNSAINGIQNQVNTNKAGIAGVTAATNLPGLSAGQNYNFGVAWGNYQAYNGVAIGGHARVTDNVTFKVSGSATSGVYSGGAGMSIGF